ncbi:hypothetical protein BYT27DRAFT_7214953 [Phlegmacium glaucopus]|nr:hypothetical protein BYT27DRAFT_7214953 [Phlegmacium glaucopus]
MGGARAQQHSSRGPTQKKKQGDTKSTQKVLKEAEDARDLIAVVLGQICVVVAMLDVKLVWAFTRSWRLTLAGLAIAPVFAGAMAKAFVEGCTYGGLIYLAEALLVYVGAVLVSQGRSSYLQVMEVSNLMFSVTIGFQLMVLATADLNKLLSLDTSETSESQSGFKPGISGTTRLHNVNFSYPGDCSRTPVLKCVNLKINQGEGVAINTPWKDFLDNSDKGDLVSELRFPDNCVPLQISGPEVAFQFNCKSNSGSSFLALENQVVHRLAKEYHPEGKRTIGVLTKPDRILSGEDTNWPSFTRNENETLKPPSSSDIKLGTTWAQARKREEELFCNDVTMKFKETGHLSRAQFLHSDGEGWDEGSESETEPCFDLALSNSATRREGILSKRFISMKSWRRRIKFVLVNCLATIHSLYKNFHLL